MKRGFIVVTHGKFGSGLIDAIEMVTGKLHHVRVISLERDESCEELGKQIAIAAEELREAEELVIFTDLLGGTPCNQGTVYGRKEHVYTIAGVNMPMMIEFILASEEEPLDEVVERSIESARNGILVTSRGKEYAYGKNSISEN